MVGYKPTSPGGLHLNAEERKHLALHLMGVSYPQKAHAEMSLHILRRLGYTATITEGGVGEEVEPTEWTVTCEELV